MNYTEKIQRNSNDILIIATEEEELFRKKFKDTSTDRKCTICGDFAKDFHPHPALRVIVCSDCLQYYDSTVFLLNKDGTDKNCRWCANVSSKYCCTSCTVVFCPECLNRNFGSTYVNQYVKNNPDWKCLICNQKQLWALRAQCANAENTETDDELDLPNTEETAEIINNTSTQNTNSENETDDSSSGFEKIPELLKNKELTPDAIKEAREIFEPSKINFDRLIDKIKYNYTSFSKMLDNNEFKSATDVLEITKKVSCMCKCIYDVAAWIDGCNRNAYKEWFNKNICENPEASKSQQSNCSIVPTNTQNTSLNSTQNSTLNSTQISTQNSSQTTKNELNDIDRPDSKISDQSIDLLQTFNNKTDANNTNANKSDTNEIDRNETDKNKIDSNKTDTNKIDSNKTDTNKIDSNKTDTNKTDVNNSDSNKSNLNETDLISHHVNTKSDILNSSQETYIKQSSDADEFDDNKELNKELRKAKTKVVLQSLRLKKPKPESHSGLSENFMNFLDEVKIDLSKTEKPQEPILTSIKSEPIDSNNSVFSHQTVRRDSSQNNEENVSKDVSKEVSKDVSKEVSKTASFTQNGILELQNRILADFDETGSGINVELKTVQYLCDKTGDIFEGFEICSSGNNTPNIWFNDVEEFCSDLDDTCVYSPDFCNMTIENLRDCVEEMFSYSPELIKLLNNDFTEKASAETTNEHEERNAEKTKGDETKAEEIKAEEIKAEEIKAEEIKAEETNVKEIKGEDTNGEETNVEETNAKETNAKETNAKETNAKETIAEKTNENETDENETNENEANEDESNEDDDETSEHEDIELKNANEKEKEFAYKYLLDSDCSTYSSMTSLSSLSSSSVEENFPIREEESRGYIQTLDIANELHKLRNNLPQLKTESSSNSLSSSSNSVVNNQDVNKEDADKEDADKEDADQEDANNKDVNSKDVNKVDVNKEDLNNKDVNNEDVNTPEEDPKFSQKCQVRLDRVDFDKLSYLQKKPNTSGGYKVLIDESEDSESDEDKEINKLLNLSTLNKKKRPMCSDSSSSDSKKTKNPKKKLFTSKSECDTDSSSSSSSTSSKSSSDDILSDYELPPVVPNKKQEHILNDLISSDTDFSLKEISSDSDSDSDDDDKKKKKTNKKSTKKVEVPDWKKDTLLTGRLNVSSSNTEKNKTAEVNDELLEKQEVKFLEKSENKSYITTLKKKSLDDQDAIILSDSESSEDSESDVDSDIIFVSNKRKKTDADEKENENVPHKKGRKNIKKVLDDSELQEETLIADKEEEMRKERISMKNRSLDAVLSQSSLSQEDIGLVLDVDEINKTPLVKIPQVLVNPLKPHQINGIKFMWDVCFESLNQIKKTAGAGCILAHCMGLGKTMQVVVLTYTLLTHQSTGLRYTLIICPLSTVFNWRNEFEQTLKNAPETLNIFDLRSDRHRSFRDRIFQVKNWRKKGGVMIMGYDSFTALVNEKKLSVNMTENYRDVVLEALINPGPDLIVCDEGHILKNCKTHKFKALNRVHTKRRIILTGTPLQNNLMEYWHMVSFVKPHLLGTYKEYSNRFVNPIMNGQYQDSSPTDIQLMKKRSHVLHKKLQTTVHRYELSELKQYLPNKHEYVLFIQLSALQIKLYELYLEMLKGKTRSLFQNFHDLQNIWTHPALLHHRYEKKKTYDEDFDPKLDRDTVNSQNALGENWYKDHMPSDLSTNLSYGSKIVILFSIIRESALGEKVLVFSSSIQELDLIEGFLKNDKQTWIKNSDYYRMDGSVLPEQRMRYCNSFNDKKNKRAKLFLISHKVGGLGLNLIAANRVVLMDVNWNPAYDTQSVFRVYRFGQVKPCYIYRLVSLGTMEELVYSRAVTKLAISCRVVDEQQIRRHFKEDDQHKLYKLNTDYLNEEPVTPNVPTDRLLANLWGMHKPVLYNFKDHQSMLENLAHEELNEEEMKLAWEEFKNEEKAEQERLVQLQNAKELYKQQMMAQQPHPQYNPTPSTSGFIQPQQITRLIQPISPQQITRFKPVNPLPNTRPLQKTPYPFVPNTRPHLPAARPSISTVSSPRPISLISNTNNTHVKPNPFSSFIKNSNQSTETIIPDIIPNNIPAHSNNFRNMPSTSSAHVPNVADVPNIPGNVYNSNSKKIYGDPKLDKTQNQNTNNINTNNITTNNDSASNSNNGSKRMPKLLPVPQNNRNILDIELLAKNGVSVSPNRKKITSKTINHDEIIDLE